MLAWLGTRTGRLLNDRTGSVLVMVGLPPHHDAHDSLGDISYRERVAADSQSAFPVSLHWVVFGTIACPAICVGVPAGEDRGVLDLLADPKWELASIGTVKWSVSYSFSQDLDPEDCVARIELSLERGGVPDGAEIGALYAAVRLVAANSDGEDIWPTESVFSELTIEFLPDIDLPLLHQLAMRGIFAVTTPEAGTDTGSVTVLCDSTDESLPNLLQSLGMWDKTLAAQG